MFSVTMYFFFFFFFKVYFIDYATTVSCPIFFLHFIPLCPAPRFRQHSPPISSCPLVIHITSLASTFPTLFLISPCLFCTYDLCFLFPVHFPPFPPLPANNPPCDLHFCDSVPVLVVCLVCFCFGFRCGC